MKLVEHYIMRGTRRLVLIIVGLPHSWWLSRTVSLATDRCGRQREANNAKINPGRFAPFAVPRRHALAGELVISAGDSCGSTHNPAFAAMGRN